jgi:DeoR/GlpR family transcriptional regulator of sugar metabolism
VDITRELYLEERRQAILEEVNQKGRASVADLSRAFGVSEVTIRADLQALADRNLILRTHGGAVPGQSEFGELALALRRGRQVREKSRIGRAGAALVADGDAIFLDSSSTSLAIAHHLKLRRHVTVITNSLAVVQELMDAPDVTVVMTGGTLDRATASLVGAHGLDAVRPLHIRRGFFGAHGITPAEGLTDVSSEVAEVKRPLVAMCREVVAVLDATKWGRVGVASFAALEDVNCVITTGGVPESALEQVRAFGVEVQVA